MDQLGKAIRQGVSDSDEGNLVEVADDISTMFCINTYTPHHHTPTPFPLHHHPNTHPTPFYTTTHFTIPATPAPSYITPNSSTPPPLLHIPQLFYTTTLIHQSPPFNTTTIPPPPPASPPTLLPHPHLIHHPT